MALMFTVEQVRAASDRDIDLSPFGFGFDYQNQAWIENGKYLPCAHPASMNCQCYGKIHAGEPIKF
jgi:hypothetical protein